MLSILLMRQIFMLFLIMFSGLVLVKAGLLKNEDAKPLSILHIYLIMPCVVINAYLQIDYSPEIRSGFFFSAGIALFIHLVLLLFVHVVLKPLKLRSCEQASIIYCNSGNLMIPLVIAILGEEWTIYATAFLCVQILFMWTHAITIMRREPTVSIGKMLSNPIFIAALIGIFLFFTGIRFPDIVMNAIDAVAATIGPLTMITIGMMLSTVDFRAVFTNRRIYLVLFLKMLAVPALITVLLKALPIAGLFSNASQIMLLNVMTIAAPTATLISQMASLYDNEPDYASAISVASTLVCIVTMPLAVWFFELW